MAHVSTQDKGVEILSGVVLRTEKDVSERRRPGRREQVSPHLLALLRGADKVDRSEVAGKLNPALALAVIATCSATLWFGIIRTAMWMAR